MKLVHMENLMARWRKPRLKFTTEILRSSPEPKECAMSLVAICSDIRLQVSAINLPRQLPVNLIVDYYRSADSKSP